MGRVMLFCILFLPLTASEISTVLTPNYQWTTPQQIPGRPKVTTDISKQTNTKKTQQPIVQPKAKAMEIVTHMVTTTPTLMSQTQNITNMKSTTIHTTKDVQTSTIYNNPTLTPMVTAKVENAEPSTPVTNRTQRPISSTILSTSFGYISSMQTGTIKTETPGAEVPAERATTRLGPMAKLSVTTQSVSSVQRTTNLGKTSRVANVTNIIPTVKLSTTTLRTASVHKTTMKLAQTTIKTDPPVITKETEDAQKAIKHGKIVAGLIGSALIAMMIGFLIILYKKYKLKKQQTATIEWAGVTPFLETGGGVEDNNGHVTLRSDNRISLTSFLPQRLSKRLSLLAETREKMQDIQEMTIGTTFAVKEEKNDTKSDKSLGKSGKEGSENNSESLEKTEELVLGDDKKEDEGDKSKTMTNGQPTTEDGETGQLEKEPTRLAPKEDAPVETKNLNREQIEKDDAKLFLNVQKQHDD